MCSGASTCHALVPAGPIVTPTVSAAAAPAPTGGNLANGLYELQSVTLYTDAGNVSMQPEQMSIQYTNGVAQSVDTDSQSDGGCTYHRETGAVSFDGGNTLVYAQTCQCDAGTMCAAQNVGYSVMGRNFILYIPQSNGGVREQRFLR